MMPSKGLRTVATDLQRMIIEQLNGDGMNAKIKNGALIVNDVNVSMSILEDWSRGYSLRPLGTLRVRVDGLWRHGKTIIPTRTFPSAKSRHKTHGIDLPKLSKHVQVLSDRLRDAQSKEQKTEKSIATWRSAIERIKAEFPEADAVMRATANGIRFDVTLNEATARRVLRALRSAKGWL